MQRAAVFFVEEGERPMSLASVKGAPVLRWTVRRLWNEGVTRFFTAVQEDLAEQVRACFPEGAELSVSNRREDLLAFLRKEERVAVFSRAALPIAAAGPGFVYEASGGVLADTWRDRLTNAVQADALLSGYVPVYDETALTELEPHFDPEEETAGD